MEKLLVENDSLSKNVSYLEIVFVFFEKYEKEIMVLKFNIVEFKKQFFEFNKKCGEDQEKIDSFMFENINLKKIMSYQYVLVKIYEEMKIILSSILDKINRELLDVKKKFEDINREFVKIKDENEILKRNLENIQN